MSAKNNKVNWKLVNDFFSIKEFVGTGFNQYGIVATPYGFPTIVDPITTSFSDGSVVVDPAWDLPKKAFVTTAITGAFISKQHNPNQPVRPDEIKASIHRLCEAGAPLIHVHTRDENLFPTVDYDAFHDYIDSTRKEFPNVRFDGCIVPTNEREWNNMVALIKEKFFDNVIVNCLASYNGDFLFCKPPHIMIEKTRLALEYGQVPVFAVNSVGDIDNADRYLIKTELVDNKPTYWGILLALPGALPMHNPKAMVEGLMIMVNRIREIDPQAVIQVCAAGRACRFLVTLALLMGLDIRVGMEDSIWKWPHRNDMQKDNVESFLWAKQMVELLGYELGTGEEWVKHIRGEI